MSIKHVDTGTCGLVTILVSGFGAFPGAHSNPTLKILHQLDRRRARLRALGIHLDTAILPVVYDQIDRAMGEAATTRPDAILHLGLAAARRQLCAEVRAANRANGLRADAAGRRTAPILAAGGPPFLQATYPAKRIAAAARAAGVPAKLSIDAGGYVCNAALYGTLRDRLADSVGFIHVPRPPSSARPLSSRRGTGTDDLTRAVFAAVVVMARDARPRRRLAS